jgi:nitrogen fixation-related uncharacterized protein
MDLSTYLIGATVVTFLVGATFALAWSISSGQWRNLSAQALVPLLDEDDPPAPARASRAPGAAEPEEASL